MTKKKIFLLMMVIITLIGISAVSAAENATDDTITADTNEKMNLEEIDDKAILNETDDEIIGIEDEDNLESTEGNHFTDLYEAINGNTQSTVNLNKDYVYDHHKYYEWHDVRHFDEIIRVKVEKDYYEPYKEGIPINRDVTINGNGHTIDGLNLASIFEVKGGHVTLVNIHFKNSGNSAVYGTDFTAKDCTFTNNYGDEGGAMRGGTAINCTFNGNSAGNRGGAIFRGTAINCTFTSNKGVHGGALSGGTATDCNFTQNTANEGGATNGATVTRCRFTENTATKGGAVYGGKATDCNFTQNTANEGGAAYSSEATDCIFQNNQATDMGGAAYNTVAKESKFLENIAHQGGALHGSTATDCLFHNNTATSDGGAAHNATVERCNFTQNRAANTGGAISDCIARNSLFTNNTAEYGGAMDRGRAESCTFTNNTAFKIRMWAYEYGGDGGAISKAEAIDCIFTNNKADREGGAIVNGLASNCIFQENEAVNGGALGHTNSVNCRFTQNRASNYGGAIHYCNAYDAIFTNNTASFAGSAINEGNAYNCTFINNQINGHQNLIFYGKAILCIFDEGQFNASETTVVPADLIAYDMIVGYNASHKLNFNLTAENINYDGFNTTLTIYENGLYKGTYYALSGQDNGWTVNLEPGTYNVTLSIADRPGVNNATMELIVMTTTSLKAEDMTTVYGTEDYLTVTLTYDDNKPVNEETIKVDLEGIKNYTVDSNGQIKVPTKGLDAGVHVARIGFDGDEDYLGSFQIVLITVNQAPTQITVQNVTTTYNNNKDLVITLKDNQNNPLSGFNVTVELNGTKTYTTDANGTVKVATNVLSAGTYDVNITFAGNENYTQANATAKVTINKEQSKITAVDVETTYNINKDLVITLTDSKGNALKGFNMTVDLNGAKTYTTDNNGQVTINTAQLVPNTYTAKITFNGNTNYLNSEKSVKVTVKKIASKITAKKKTFKKSKKVKKYTITLKSGKTPIKKAKVTIKIGKKTYKAKTNAKGKATFKIKKLTKKGKYKAVIKYNGDNYYNKASKKVKITVK